MATTTTKLGLTKPAYTDVVDVADLNTNADKLDAAAGFTIVANAAARPASPWTGQVIYQVDVTSSFMWDGTAWQPAGGGGGSIEISATAPASPSAGDLWWDSDNGNLYIYYDDGTSQQWVAANGPQVFVGTSAPAGYQGQLWFDSTTGKVYIYYDDGTSSQWVAAIGGQNIQSSDLPAGTVLKVVQSVATTVFSTTSGSFQNTGFSATITPQSVSNKILVLISYQVGQTGTSDSTFATVFRDSTNISPMTVNPDFVRTYTASSATGYNQGISYLDSPNTTSAITYSLHIRTDGIGGTAYVGRIGANAQTIQPTMITLMEVAG